MRRIAAALGAALLALAIAPPATAAAPGTAAPSCGIAWGSLPKTDPALSAAAVAGVRAGAHECFDRMVVDLSGKVAGYSVRYVDDVVEPGNGRTVSVAGGARLQVTVTAPSYAANGTPTYSPADPGRLADVTGFQAFRQIAWAGSYEGYTDFGLGVRARLPFQVIVLDGPRTGSRLVIDVAHHW